MDLDGVSVAGVCFDGLPRLELSKRDRLGSGGLNGLLWYKLDWFDLARLGRAWLG